MFVSKSLKVMGVSVLTTMMTLAGATAAVAEDLPDWKSKDGIIPIEVTLTDILPEGEKGGPIYISIQTRENYQSMKGFGGVIKQAPLGTTTETYYVDAPGEYSVSIWHDRDDNGRFSMDESYNILDSWGASGTVSANARPTFDDVKIDVSEMGASVTIEMLNPE